MMRRAARPLLRRLRRAAAAAGLAAALVSIPPRAAPPVRVLPQTDVAQGFAQADAPRAFLFPRDHGPHPEFRQEWWYVTGNLDAADGARFGFELTFFRFALAPGAAAAAAPDSAASAWRTREIWMAHFAVTDVAGKRFRFAQKLSRTALGLAGGSAAPPAVWIDDWSLSYAPGEPGSWTLRAAQPGYAIELTLQPRTAPVLNGDAGLSRKAPDPGAASYYYSVPRLAVRGRLLREGAALAVTGRAWLDREWGSGGLGARQSGWDWFALQLEDGTELMFYALRERDGARDAYSAGTWIDAAGSAHPLSNADVAIEVLDHWSNAAGDRYPGRWRVRVPHLALDLTVRPVLADQELHATPRYWEGAVDVSGAAHGRSVGGRGYVELVGYAR
jgi:predicted secreted hydrolase